MLISHEHYHVILWSCGLVKIFRWISGVQTYEHHRSENGMRTQKILPGWLCTMNHLIQKNFFLKKVIAVVLRSTIMSKWELEAILQLLQVMERSKSSKIFDKSSSIQGPLQKSKIKMQNIYLWIGFCQNAFWNQKTLRTRSGHPCTVSAIFPWQWQVSFNGLGIPYRDRQIHKPQVPRK